MAAADAQAALAALGDVNSLEPDSELFKSDAFRMGCMKASAVRGWAGWGALAAPPHPPACVPLAPALPRLPRDPPCRLQAKAHGAHDLARPCSAGGGRLCLHLVRLLTSKASELAAQRDVRTPACTAAVLRAPAGPSSF